MLHNNQNSSRSCTFAVGNSLYAFSAKRSAFGALPSRSASLAIRKHFSASSALPEAIAGQQDRWKPASTRCQGNAVRGLLASTPRLYRAPSKGDSSLFKLGAHQEEEVQGSWEGLVLQP